MGIFGQQFGHQHPAQQQSAKRPGFLGEDGWGAKLGQIGAIWRDDPQVAEGYRNDAQQRHHEKILQLLAEQRRQQELQDYQTHRSDQNADWMSHQQWERDNPKPSDDAFTRALEAANIKPGTPEYIEMARQRAQMLTQPVQLVPDGMGGMTAIRPNTMGTEAPETITEDMWNSGTPVGGVQSPASRPFQQAFPQGIFQTR